MGYCLKSCRLPVLFWVFMTPCGAPSQLHSAYSQGKSSQALSSPPKFSLTLEHGDQCFGVLRSCRGGKAVCGIQCLLPGGSSESSDLHHFCDDIMIRGGRLYLILFLV